MMKINKLEIENVKRVKAVKIEPSENGLTIIGGRNNQGKTCAGQYRLGAGRRPLPPVTGRKRGIGDPTALTYCHE